MELLYGGRDSGKSWFIASWLICCCLREENFRCLLVRKVGNTIQGSQFQMIKDVAEAWGVAHLFHFNISPLEIRCVNGNKFICKGLDEPGKLKSTANPSHAWGEEIDQWDLNDFIVLVTTVRSKNLPKFWFSFNPETEESEFTDNWIYKTFYANQSDPYNDFLATWEVEVLIKGKLESLKLSYRSTHTTYDDNENVNPIRIAFLEKLKDIDPYYYEVYRYGRWGNKKITDPYCVCFDRKKHVGKTKLDRGKEVYLSFDFNVNPITCGVYQHYNQTIYGIEAIKLDQSDIYKLCETIKLKYPNCLYIVTGDATGQNTSALVQDGINYYTVIREKLRLSPNQLRVPVINPKVSENRVLVNAAFSQYKVILDQTNCGPLIFDCQNVSVDAMGAIDKGDRKNPKKRADHLDHFRYYLNTFHKNILKF